VKTGSNLAEIFYRMLWLKEDSFANDDINQSIFVMETLYVFFEEESTFLIIIRMNKSLWFERW
jgi:hypothetical protein